MAEKTASELLREQLAYKRKNGRLYSDESIVNAADSYCDGYKAFLDKAKTEREAAKAAMEMAKAAGFTEFEHGKKYSAGDRVFFNNRGKTVAFAVIGKQCELRDGGRLCDISPTIIKLLGLTQPKEMTGESIIK